MVNPLNRQDFEPLADAFSQQVNQGRSIARCDVIEIHHDKVLLVEITHYTHPQSTKDLAERKTFQGELQEHVRKMWGSYAVWVWLRTTGRIPLPPAQRFELRYVVQVPRIAGNHQISRLLKMLLDRIAVCRNGAMDGVYLRETP